MANSSLGLAWIVLRLVVQVLKLVWLALSQVEIALKLAGGGSEPDCEAHLACCKTLRQTGMVMKLAWRVLRLAEMAPRLVRRVRRLVGTALSLVGRDFKPRCKGPETHCEGREPG